MREVLNIFIRGEPQPMPRPRARAVRTAKGDWIATVYQPERAAASDGGGPLDWVVWKRAILRVLASMRHPGVLTGPTRCDIDFWFPRPAYLLTPKSPQGQVWHTVKPDFDNCTKLVLDALTRTKDQPHGLWDNDAIVCASDVQKHWVARGMAHGARIIVNQLEEEAPLLFNGDAAAAQEAILASPDGQVIALPSWREGLARVRPSPRR